MSSIAWTAQTLSLPDRVVYPEREDRSDHWLERLDIALRGLGVVHAPVLRTTRLFRIVKLADAHRLRLEAMDDNGLRTSARDLGVELRRVGFSDPVVGRVFALVREVARRTLGMRHFDVQLVGGFAMLKGMVAEMETGEGKTLAATLPACAAAFCGIPVHIVTVNDYLAKRDADWMGPVYRALGLTVGVVTQGMEAAARRAAYRCDVTYCTNKELAFDYLRDRMLLGNQSGNLRLKLERLYGNDARTQKLLLRGLCFAIVDEIDSVLIDEARTPLVITGQAKVGDQQRGAEQALELVGQLEKDADYRIFMGERRVELTERGKARLRELAEPLGGIWEGTILSEELAHHALAAIYLFARDEHYLVRDGKIQVVDEYTGRIMNDRYWGEGLHQMIEAKEGCPVTGRRGPVARITYQRVFRRYQHLCGMTGTAQEVAGELWSVFHLPVATVPTNRPLHRVRYRDRIYPTTEQKWQAITQRVAELHRQGRPVLLGTRSVAASERASHYLSQVGLEHQVLNATQDRHEAEIIACAGELGRITTATNMAGRGTDIKLGTGVAELGGLHIIMSERHDAGRIDRQLAGRCGRHGEPGSVEAILSLEDPLLETAGSGRARRLATSLALRPGGRSGQATFDRAQRQTERAHSRMRRDLLRMDQKLSTMLAFSGRVE